MGNFIRIKDTEIISKYYSSRVVLYLESKEDLEVLRERWFRDLSEWIVFQSVDRAEGGGGG
ncbi:hypothetical protein WCLP8_2030005 [uncultured Gammaproteobacteria bacterium]